MHCLRTHCVVAGISNFICIVCVAGQTSDVVGPLFADSLVAAAKQLDLEESVVVFLQSKLTLANVTKLVHSQNTTRYVHQMPQNLVGATRPPTENSSQTKDAFQFTGAQNNTLDLKQPCDLWQNLSINQLPRLAETFRSTPVQRDLQHIFKTQGLSLIPYPAFLEELAGLPLVLASNAIRLEAPQDAHAMVRKQMFGIETQLVERETASVTLKLEYAGRAQVKGADKGQQINVEGQFGEPKSSAEKRDQQHQRQQLEYESYELDVIDQPKTVRIRAPSHHGLFNGIMTFRQLIQNDPQHGWIVPKVKIRDVPSFAWRGLMLDVSRHFFDVDHVKKFLNTMKLFKYNHLHLHLTDDQGWRLESQKYQNLTSIGAWREGTQIGHNPGLVDHKRYGGYFTKENMRDIAAFGRELYINIMPEIDLPGHAQAAIAAYPGLGNTDIPAWKSPDVARTWGVHDYTLAPRQTVLKFAEDVMDEAIDAMPSEYVHIGGDEVLTNQWKQSKYAADFMLQKSLASPAMIQRFFTNHLADHLSKRGRKIVLWDDALKDNSAPAGSTIMVWTPGNNRAVALDAATKGHDVIVAPHDETYFDLCQDSEDIYDCFNAAPFLPIQKTYNLRIQDFGSPAPTGRVIGGQAQLWSEYIHNWSELEYHAWPRGLALSEVLWTGATRPGWNHFASRLGPQLEKLKKLGVNFKSYGFTP